ncbi:hypothetical protein [Nevskia ramosa]|uniref:hypothetical protein n=1 Tax=Nevskia ramosa TaxID=64002 RepID=UPI0023544204|nr:hypothetical protein [Nevskia ramosa]
MKRTLLALALLAAAGSASAQAVGNLSNLRVPQALDTLLTGSNRFQGGLLGGLPALLAGNTTNGFLAFRNGVSGFAVTLTENSRLEKIGTGTETLFVKGYDALEPLYQKIDNLTVPLLEPLNPKIQPLLLEVIGLVDGTYFALTGLPTSSSNVAVPITRSGNSLPGLDGLRLR